jgi:hypothetical protein
VQVDQPQLWHIVGIELQQQIAGVQIAVRHTGVVQQGEKPTQSVRNALSDGCLS